jgi:putative ABC transport system permease protein
MLVPGVIAGLALGMLASALVESLLFGITSRDPSTLTATIGVLFVAALGAAYVPALRASRVNPAVALRGE